MAKRQHIIELNGKRFDALTGKPISGEASPKKPTATTAARITSQAPKHLDGFTRRSRSVTTNPGATKVHHKTEKSHTLMRTVVKKPTATKIHAKTSATTPLVSNERNTHPEALVEAVKPGRVLRANAISQSSLISKFGAKAASIKTEVLPVRQAPSHATAAVPHSSQKMPTTQQSSTVAPQRAREPFQSALENATSHQQPKLKKVRTHHKIAQKLHVSPRIVSAAGFTIVALAVGGFFAYQNLPELTMKIAATRAGLRASLPSYQPSGFSLAGPIQYAPGQVTINYKSHSDKRQFNVVQKNSSWNSETLLENFVTTTNQPYQTYQANGRTIYIYDGTKATWVDGGVWYSIDGEASLNSDQLLRIAGSL